jgi:hypothetical protein
LYVEVVLRGGLQTVWKAGTPHHVHRGCWRLRFAADVPEHWRLANPFASGELRSDELV